MKSQVLLTVWCNMTGEATGEIWTWTLLGVKELKCTVSTFCMLLLSGHTHLSSIVKACRVLLRFALTRLDSNQDSCVLTKVQYGLGIFVKYVWGLHNANFCMNYAYESTILDKSPWDRLKLWQVVANHSVFNTLKGHIYANWRLPSPLSMLLRKSALSACWFNFERGRGKSKRDDFQRKSAGVPTLV